MNIKWKKVWVCWWVGTTDELGRRVKLHPPRVGAVFDSEQEALDAIEMGVESKSIFGGDGEKHIAQSLPEALVETAQAYRVYLKEDSHFYNVVNTAIYCVNALLLMLAVTIALLVDGWMSFFILLLVPVGWLWVTRWFRDMYWQNKEEDPDSGKRMIRLGFGAAYRAGQAWESDGGDVPSGIR